MRGGPSPYARRTKLKEHADGYHSGAIEIRVKGNRHRSKEEELCRGYQQAGPEEEEQC